MLLVADARPATVDPVRCPHFGPCGGCSLLEQPYDAECRQKERVFERWTRARAPLREAELLPLLRAEEPLFYRTSLKIPFGLRARAGAAPRVVSGFYRRGTHRIVDLHVCAIQHPRLTRLLVGVRRAVEELGVPVDARARTGILRHLLARVGLGTGEVLAGFVVRRGDEESIARLARTVQERFARHGLVGLVENVNAAPGPRVLGPITRSLGGASELRSLEDGLRISTSLTTFTQVNAAQAQLLYREVVDWIEPQPGKRVVDLYSGYGPIALRLARAGADVVAVERDPTASAEGRRAAEENALASRLRFEAGDAARVARELAAVDAVVVDPPRRGLSPALVERLREAPIERLVYVSCDPKTFLRDLTLLAESYAVRRLRAVDLFPRTRHLEALALLERRAH
jgi:23S rRNA (uracil1939-C5)-methyltransferase